MYVYKHVGGGKNTANKRTHIIMAKYFVSQNHMVHAAAVVCAPYMSSSVFIYTNAKLPHNKCPAVTKKMSPRDIQ